GNRRRTFSTTFPIIPCLGLPLPVPGLPGHFRFSGHFSVLHRHAHCKVLSVMSSIPSVSLSDCLLVANWTVLLCVNLCCPPFIDLCYSHGLLCFACRRPRPLAWTITTPLDLSSPHQYASVDQRLFKLSDLIKLSQMDPPSPDSSLTSSQKTLPPTDPATASQFASEMSAQATMLTLHQQQLDRLTALTEQLVRAVQGLQVATPPVASPPPPPAQLPVVQPVTASPRLAFPDKFDGTPTKCKGFLLQCTLFVNQQPNLYATDESKIAFVCSLLTGKALEWATAVWDLGQSTYPTFATFLRSFKEVFQPTPESSEAGEQIVALRQGRRTAAEYALDFRTLAAQSGWNDGPLKLHYRKGLNSDLQVELACRDENLSLNQYIDLSIRVDNVMHARKPSRPFTPTFQPQPSASSAPEPMQLGTTKLTTEERERRLCNHLCLYCGQPGHIRATCPTRPPRPPTSVSVFKTGLNRCEIPVLLCSDNISIQTTALIDSGAAGNCIDKDFVEANRGRPRRETVRDRSCRPHHQGPHPPPRTQPSGIHSVLQLPPHRPGDCAIELTPGAVPPRGRIFPLSQPESEAMEKYIKEELAKGFIRPSTSPASAGFFFVKKKDGGLRPCIDYRSLNEITVKYRYPLPLVPPALEQLRSARYYTKLDLHSAYNLIRIREGDEWKTDFSTTSGHYEYRVMPFGLANSPSYFQAFVNEVFRDMLNRWIIVYIDDILIFSSSNTDHVRHVRAVLKRLIQHQLYAKEEKCQFHQEKISFLGYVISPEGVAMEESKVNATLKELQRFLGFSNFYRRFIRNFSTVAGPLTSMVKRGNNRLSWSPEAVHAFNDLRLRFTSAPILKHPDPQLPFIVEVDASSTGVGAILSQRQGQNPKTFPCAFFSHKLSPAEKNYDVGNRELLAIKLALEEWRHWLEGAQHPFIILTDHKNLEYLRTAKVLNHRQARWALFFTRFHFTINYRPGTQNLKADALSRIHEPDHTPLPPETILPASVLVAPVTWDVMTEITEAQARDPPPTDCPENRTYVPADGPLNSQLRSPWNRGHNRPFTQPFLVAVTPPRHCDLCQELCSLQHHQGFPPTARRVAATPACPETFVGYVVNPERFFIGLPTRCQLDCFAVCEPLLPALYRPLLFPRIIVFCLPPAPTSCTDYHDPFGFVFTTPVRQC
ncbi:hypothetical protein M9458_000775, partial [Cirrhinus mrigala]